MVPTSLLSFVTWVALILMTSSFLTCPVSTLQEGQNKPKTIIILRNDEQLKDEYTINKMSNLTRLIFKMYLNVI